VLLYLASRTSPDFDPRRLAVERTYRYYITETPRPLIRNSCYEIHRGLAIDKLNRAARLFKGRHDFSGFCKRKSLKEDNHCRVIQSRWFRYSGLLVYEVKADRFLHHMVRRMVGTMLAHEDSKINLTQLKAFLNNEINAKFSVPAQGLVLVNVKYRREKR
jgi:tRNA pseudouridine38-40 synthase